MSNNEIMIFDHEEFGELRTIEIEGEIYFVGLVVKMIECGDYFTINRARQYGKTTMLNAIFDRLKDQYYVLDISFEGADDIFNSLEVFCKGLRRLLIKNFKFLKAPQKLMDILSNVVEDNFSSLSDAITELCETSDKEIVLLIDEVDKNSNNKVLLGFLAMLRNKYLEREKDRDYTFKSVILAGVYDIKNLKLKIRSEEDARYNSPWNIATDFNVDMSFNPQAIAEEIYNYTSGYPYLVSCICKTIHEKLEQDWSENGVKSAIKIILDDKNLLFDEIFQTIESDQELSSLVQNIVVKGYKYPYNYYYQPMGLGKTIGVFKSVDSVLSISNKVFEEFLYKQYTYLKR